MLVVVGFDQMKQQVSILDTDDNTVGTIDLTLAVKLSKRVRLYGIHNGAVVKVYTRQEIPRLISRVAAENAASQSSAPSVVNNPLFEIDNTTLKKINFDDKIQEIQIPEGITQISAYAGTQGKMGGSPSCPNCKTVIFPATLKTIWHSAFRGWKSLEAAIDAGGLERIDTSAFEDCSKLERFTFPVSLRYIGEAAFAFCAFSRFPEIYTIPNLIVGKQAFAYNRFGKVEFNGTCRWEPEEQILEGCQSLKFITVAGRNGRLGKNMFYGCNNLYHVEFERNSGVNIDETFKGTTFNFKVFQLGIQSIEKLFGGGLAKSTHIEQLLVPKECLSAENKRVLAQVVKQGRVDKCTPY